MSQAFWQASLVVVLHRFFLCITYGNMLTKLGKTWPLVLLCTIIHTELSHAAFQSRVVDAKNYSTWMLDSIIADRAGIGSSGAATSQIELVGTFQEIVPRLRSHTDLLSPGCLSGSSPSGDPRQCIKSKSKGMDPISAAERCQQWCDRLHQRYNGCG